MKAIPVWLRIGVSIFLFAWFLAHANLAGIGASLSRLSLLTVLLLILLDLLAIILDTVQWFVLVPEHHFMNLLRANLASKFYGLVLPGQLLGEVGKVLHLNAHTHEIEKVTASVVLDKLIGLVGGVFFIGAVGALMSHISPQWVAYFFLVATISGVLALMLLKNVTFDQFIVRTLKALVRYMPRMIVIADPVERTMSALRALATSRRRIVLALVTAVLFQGLGAAIATVVAYAIGVPISFFDWCWIFSLLSIILLIPVSIGGLGLRDATLIGILGLFAVSPAQAVTIAFVLFALQIVQAGIGFVAIVYK